MLQLLKRMCFCVVCWTWRFHTKYDIFSLKDVPSQDGKWIETTIRYAFAENDLWHLVFHVFFFGSDGANVNSGLKSGLITQFQETGLNWVGYVWCISHHLELALKDSLPDAMSGIH